MYVYLFKILISQTKIAVYNSAVLLITEVLQFKFLLISKIGEFLLSSLLGKLIQCLTWPYVIVGITKQSQMEVHSQYMKL